MGADSSGGDGGEAGGVGVGDAAAESVGQSVGHGAMFRFDAVACAMVPLSGMATAGYPNGTRAHHVAGLTRVGPIVYSHTFFRSKRKCLTEGEGNALRCSLVENGLKQMRVKAAP